MAKGIARYIVTNGLAGCFMPDSNHGPLEFSTRRELAGYIRSELESVFPDLSGREYRRLFDSVRVKNLWRHIARHGSSVAHFSIQRQGYELAFHGVTDSEFHQAESEND